MALNFTLGPQIQENSATNSDDRNTLKNRVFSRSFSRGKVFNPGPNCLAIYSLTF